MGGNLPVDSAIFLEFLPASHQYLLTVLSIDWSLAQVFATLVAWPLLSNLTCQEDQTVCTRRKNIGWRYFIITIGGVALIMFFIRFVLFKIFESPKFLMGRGRDEDAVRVVHEVARRNGTYSDLTVEDLKKCEALASNGNSQGTSAADQVKRELEKVNLTHVRALFATPKLAYSMTLITTVWAFIGLGYPLYNAVSPLLNFR